VEFLRLAHPLTHVAPDKKSRVQQAICDLLAGVLQPLADAGEPRQAGWLSGQGRGMLFTRTSGSDLARGGSCEKEADGGWLDASGSHSRCCWGSLLLAAATPAITGRLFFDAKHIIFLPQTTLVRSEFGAGCDAALRQKFSQQVTALPSLPAVDSDSVRGTGLRAIQQQFAGSLHNHRQQRSVQAEHLVPAPPLFS
jgi:hypothetical protein